METASELRFNSLHNIMCVCAATARALHGNCTITSQACTRTARGAQALNIRCCMVSVHGNCIVPAEAAHSQFALMCAHAWMAGAVYWQGIARLHICPTQWWLSRVLQRIHHTAPWCESRSLAAALHAVMLIKVRAWQVLSSFRQLLGCVF
jgi:hypothetical protein